MRHPAYYARWLAMFWLLAAHAGCGGIGLRRNLDHGETTPEQAAQINRSVNMHRRRSIGAITNRHGWSSCD